MTKLELKNHQIWRDLTEILENLDSDALLKEHLELCDYKVCGYWDENDGYYQEIILPRDLTALLVSSSIGFTHTKRFFQLKFVLLASTDATYEQPNHNDAQKIGELILIYDENLEFIDENWVLDVHSPSVEAKCTNTNSL
ncbi:hypothetical protein CEN45_00810 [Fischerella thermalis CCMEE 5198]|jgi:hypothetical protein|nr:hypothetical protein [Fischerella thermalis]PMB05651.1 hypothetical protein CI594_02985 [Fischerella thermalis CCMEE 5196]PMB19683.1 hypothetical protein CEN47_22895 [Fischerella thermalis CCMEE 5319]PMB27693.1 hypothetical protein CEN45_00810 [Fischerella thermalis CCMEE 5198]PMB52124.1 hypothetical protein CEN39_11440 [Fischerella thermalis CCMEE 5201]